MAYLVLKFSHFYSLLDNLINIINLRNLSMQRVFMCPVRPMQASTSQRLYHTGPVPRACHSLPPLPQLGSRPGRRASAPGGASQPIFFKKIFFLHIRAAEISRPRVLSRQSLNGGIEVRRSLLGCALGDKAQ